MPECSECIAAITACHHHIHNARLALARWWLSCSNWSAVYGENAGCFHQKP